MAYLLYISCSTGMPKGVVCHYKGVIDLLNEFQPRQPLGFSDRCGWRASLSCEALVYEIFSSLLSGAALVMVPDHLRKDGRALMEWLHENHITSAFLPPMMIPDFQEWIEHNPDKRIGLFSGPDRRRACPPHKR